MQQYMQGGCCTDGKRKGIGGASRHPRGSQAVAHRLVGRVGEEGVAAEGHLWVSCHSVVEEVHDQKFVC